MFESGYELLSLLDEPECRNMRVTIELRDLCRVILTPEGEAALKEYVRLSPLQRDPFETRLVTPEGDRVIVATLWELMHVFGQYIVSSGGKLFRSNRLIFDPGA
jgi:hypothetical protein